MWQARLVGVIWRYRRVCWHPPAHRAQSRRRNEHICNYIIAALCRQSSGFLLAVRRAVSFVRRQIEFPRRLQSPGQSCSRSAIMMCVGCSAMPNYYWSTRSARSAGEQGWCSADLLFLILSSAFCQTNYLNIYRTDLHEICTIVRPLAVDELFEVIFSIPQGTLPWQPILWAKSTFNTCLVVRMTFATQIAGKQIAALGLHCLSIHIPHHLLYV